MNREEILAKLRLEGGAYAAFVAGNPKKFTLISVLVGIALDRLAMFLF